MTVRVLVVEDEPRIAADIKKALEGALYSVDVVGDGDAAWFSGETENYDAIVLDLGLPRLDGLSVLKRWRSAGVAAPVLILTARDGWREKVEGINAGADDYLTKPFALPELEARVAALIRRAGVGPARLSHGPLEFDPLTRQAHIGGRALELSAREASLLDALMQRPGEAVIKSRLAHTLGDWGSELGHNAIEVYVHRLRRKLEPFGIRIRTLHGLGYLLEKPDAH